MLERARSTILPVLRRDASESLALLHHLPFTTTVIGHSRAEIVPQRVGAWWLEPVVDEARLPSRARQRLAAVRSSGLPIKAVVLFHELPTVAPSSNGMVVRASGRVQTWLEQELPAKSAQLRAHAHRLAPSVGWATRAVLGLTVTMLTVGAVAATTVTLGVLAAALTDPCLVVVTDDGCWIEVDRWLD